MTRKDYLAMADVIRSQLTHHPRPNWNSACATIARRFSDVAIADNQRFDAPRFYAACGLDLNGYPIEPTTKEQTP